MYQLGGNTINLTAASDFWELESSVGTVMDGKAPEHVRDASAVLSHYFDALAIRPKPDGNSWEVDRRDDRIRTWARHSRVPVINMESALWHPLQALADLLTLREALLEPRGKEIAIVWVHSPQPASASVVHSLLHGVLRTGMRVRLAHPPGYALDGGVLSEAREIAERAGGGLETDLSLEDSIQGAQIVYARSWKSLESYGNPTLQASHSSRLTEWTISEQRMAMGESAKLMHAMPVRRNVEVTDEVLDGERSLLYQQAANRLYSQMALLTRVVNG